MPVKKVYQYRIVPIDADNDGIKDYDLVEKILDGKVVARKLVPAAKMKKIAENTMKFIAKQESTPKKKKKMVYKNMPPLQTMQTNASAQQPLQQAPQQAQQAQQPVMVQDKTNFGQYVKAGLGMGIGLAVAEKGVDFVADEIGDLF
jgi:hypothetical protein